MTPTERSLPIAARGSKFTAIWACVVVITAIVVIAYDLPSEPPFPDESAYISQSYFARLYAEGRWNDAAWLSYPAYDLPPLPKYFIGAALTVSGDRIPGQNEALAWYRNISLRFVPPRALLVARLPIVALGAIGCVAVYILGVLISGRVVGALAALLLMVNPLYRLLARRAMSDVPCETFLLLGLCLALWGWSQALAGRRTSRVWLAEALAGFFAGLSLSCKLSGALTLMICAAWSVLAMVLPKCFARGLVFSLSMGSALLAAAVTFVALNPFLTAHPTARDPRAIPELEAASLFGRARKMADLRLEVARGQKRLFSHNALWTPAEKLITVAVQGYGRFGSFGSPSSDSVVRYEWSQDRGGLLWLPWVAAGAVWALVRGRAQSLKGDPPTAWALLVQFGLTLVIVTAYIPLAWDRYFLSLQAPSALLASGVAVTAVRRLARIVFKTPTEG